MPVFNLHMSESSWRAIWSTWTGEPSSLMPLQMLGSIALWYPFFKLYEKRELENEKAVEAQKKWPSPQRNEALLNDLDLDF